MAASAYTTCTFDSSLRNFALVDVTNRLQVWNVHTRQLILNVAEPNHLSIQYTSIVWGSRLDASNNEKKEVIALGTRGGHISLWDVSRGEIISQLGIKGSAAQMKSPVTKVVLNGQGTVIYASYANGNVVEWSLAANSKNAIWNVEKDGEITSLAVAPSGTVLATGSSLIKLWDIASKGKIGSFRGHATTIQHLEFSPNSALLLSAAEDRYINVWNVREGEVSEKPIKVLVCESTPIYLQFRNLVASKRGKKSARIPDTESFDVIALGSNNNVSVWRVAGNTASQLSDHPQSDKKRRADGSSAARGVEANTSTTSGDVLAVSFFENDKLLLARGSILHPVFERINFEINGQLITPLELSALKNQSVATTVQSITANAAIDGEKKKHGKAYVLGAADQASEFAVERDGPTKKLRLQQEVEASGADTESKSSVKPIRTLKDLNKLAGTASTGLMQALHSGNEDLVIQVLNAPDISISRTVAEVPPQYIVTLLQAVVTKMQTQNTPAPVVLEWIQNIINVHAKSLMKVKSVTHALQQLHLLLESRLGVYKKVLRLQGRLGVLEVQQKNKQMLQQA